MGKTRVTGIKRIFNAAGYSWAGFRTAYWHEAAFRQELWLCMVLVPLGIYLGDSIADKAILLCSLLFVLIVELLNSAIETVIDRISDDHHELSGRAKDMGSASVFLSICIAIIVWLAVLY